MFKRFDKLNERIKLNNFPNKKEKLTEGGEFLVAEPELTAALQKAPLMGDTDFETLEVEEIAKDMATIQQDAQVHKASTPVQTTERLHTCFMFPD